MWDSQGFFIFFHGLFALTLPGSFGSHLLVSRGVFFTGIGWVSLFFLFLGVIPMLLGTSIGAVLGWVLLCTPLWRLLLCRNLLKLAKPFFRTVFDFPFDICISEDEYS